MKKNIYPCYISLIASVRRLLLKTFTLREIYMFLHISNIENFRREVWIQNEQMIYALFVSPPVEFEYTILVLYLNNRMYSLGLLQ